jgi:PPM family protein phosphatase
MPNIHVSVSYRTDTGHVREKNEDALVVTDFASGPFSEKGEAPLKFRVGRKGVLLLVSDGMGGEQAGEIASAIVAERCARALASGSQSDPVEQRLKRAVIEAHREVRSAARDESRRGMGATLTAVHVTGSHAFVAEVGDSRAYLIRAGSIGQLTRDQSFAQVLADAGSLDPEVVSTSPLHHVLAQAMGQESSIRPALGRLELHDRDCLLLCSDGLTNLVSDGEILNAVQVGPTLERACSQLVDLANGRGGLDNITVVLASVSGDLPPSRAGESLGASYEVLESFGAFSQRNRTVLPHRRGGAARSPR